MDLRGLKVFLVLLLMLSFIGIISASTWIKYGGESYCFSLSQVSTSGPVCPQNPPTIGASCSFTTSGYPVANQCFVRYLRAGCPPSAPYAWWHYVCGDSSSVYTLSVSKAGTGSGTITSSPAGINCGSTCSYSYTSGNSVNLTTTPSSGSTFTGWGGACSGIGTCTVSMSAAKSVTATFNCDPSCTGKACGATNACGQTCLTGSCPSGKNCISGICVQCNPACAGKACGADDLCGGKCTSGSCPSGQICSSTGTCVCTPACADKACGADDGCGTGGKCQTGTCQYGTCSAGTCVCVSNCAGKACGADDGCGGTCATGSCQAGYICSLGTCTCTPNCIGKICGDNGCGGSCGTCSSGLTCSSDGTTCECVPNCNRKNCGPDGCSGSCGTCSIHQTCSSGTCVCAPDCLGKDCGSDNCGGSCGRCASKQTCSDTQNGGTCEYDPEPETNWTNEKNIYMGEGTPYSVITISENNPTKIKLILKESRYLTEGKTVKFDIREKNFFGNDLITSVNAVANASKIAIGEWEVDFSVIDKKTKDDYDQFYFTTTTTGEKNIQATSGFLRLIKYTPDMDVCETKSIVTCEGYSTKEGCEFNDCSVSWGVTNCRSVTRSIPEVPGCHYEIGCKCRWDETEGICGPISEEVVTPECIGFAVPYSLGMCSIGFVSQDKCKKQGFFIYNWTGLWDWGENSYTDSSRPQIATYQTQPDGKWHIPSALASFCSNGERVIVCPTAINVPFFGYLELITTLAVILFAYSLNFFLIKKRRKIL